MKYSALLLIGLAACTQPQMSEQEHQKVTTRIYANTTPQQVKDAAKRLLELADGDDFRFSYTEDSISASRNWGSYMLITYVSGMDQWSVTAKKTPQGTKVSVSAFTTSEANGVMPIGDTYVPSPGTPIGSPPAGDATYDVFFARLEYLLGKNPTWMTCSESNTRIEQKIVTGDNSMLCNSFNMKDASPE